MELAILNFTSIPEVQKYHNIFHITEKESGILYFRDLELHTIELSKFSDDYDEKLVDIATKVKNSLDMWVTFLTRHDLLKVDDLPKELNDPDLKKAINVLEVMNFSNIERQAYEEHLKWLMTEASALQKYRTEGKEEGRIEGRIEGMEASKIEIAKTMLLENEPIEKIIKYTGLTERQIKELHNK